MANTYYDSQLTAAEIEAALEAIDGVIAPANNGKVLAINNGKLEARSVQWGGGSAVLEPLSVTENGNYTPEAGVDGFDEVHVSVPNSYTSSDEGKVVSNGALVAQTERASQITQNGTYDTTLNNEVTVNVSGGGSAVVQPLSVTQNGTYNPPSGVDGYAPVTVNVSGGSSDPSLPAEYQEVEYLQCYDYQYISVGSLSRGTIVGIDLSQDTITSSESGFCGHSSGGRNELYFKDANIFWFSSMPQIDFSILSSISAGQRVSIMVALPATGDGFWIGCYRNDAYPFTGKIYRAEIKQQNNVDRILLKPCYRKADNTIGFYDVVNSVFYTNQGSGSFGKGSDVN